MSIFTQRILAIMLPVSAFALCIGMAGAHAADLSALPIDHPTQVSGVETACTGIGDREEQESRWKAYPVKFEAVGGYGQWLADENVTVRSRGGATDVSVRCNAPWLLMRLKPGRYDVTMQVPNTTAQEKAITVSAHGQRDVIMRFKSYMAGREVSQTAS
ncbi:MAG: hypothetical protein ABSD74_20295 [Rhizomicrobium sp.]|jgi:hypothetical protein